jgi:hypothetical protein
MNANEKSLYEQLVAAKIPISNWHSDLLFQATDESERLLSKFSLLKKQSEHFINRIDKTRWVSVPFAYDPWWIARQSKKPGD